MHSRKDSIQLKWYQTATSRLQETQFALKSRCDLRVMLPHKQLAGCSKWPSSKAAGESKPEAYPLGYVEDFDELRTQLADFFSILLADSIPS